MSFLLDTNVISDAMKLPIGHRVNKWLDANRHNCSISTITISEIARGIARLPNSKKRESLSKFLEALLTEYADSIFAFDVKAALAWGTLCSEAEAQGRPLGRHDSQIAAIAIARNLTIATRNTSDFTGVETCDPWQDA